MTDQKGRIGDEIYVASGSTGEEAVKKEEPNELSDYSLGIIGPGIHDRHMYIREIPSDSQTCLGSIISEIAIRLKCIQAYADLGKNQPQLLRLPSFIAKVVTYLTSVAYNESNQDPRF